MHFGSRERSNEARCSREERMLSRRIRITAKTRATARQAKKVPFVNAAVFFNLAKKVFLCLSAAFTKPGGKRNIRFMNFKYFHFTIAEFPQGKRGNQRCGLIGVRVDQRHMG
ncbi:hypothetical protein ABD76_01920 [Paenibacillus dendritiformis]|nr:hypothetical protein [Paenibacillus dendritiformis]